MLHSRNTENTVLTVYCNGNFLLELVPGMLTLLVFRGCLKGCDVLDIFR